LLGVASIVLDYGGDEEMAIAALLHDAVEDQGGRPMLKIIEQIFGARVAKIVDGCTDSYVEDPKKKENWEQRKFRYLRRLRHEDAETRFVSAADKLYNVRAVLRDLRYNGDLAFARFSAPKARIIWYYRSLVNEYRGGGVTHLFKPLLDDLDRVVVEVEHLSGLLAASPSPHRKLTTKLKSKR
jgi:(p)ppGpp synthase/HD superfamily hydrolase